MKATREQIIEVLKKFTQLMRVNKAGEVRIGIDLGDFETVASELLALEKEEQCRKIIEVVEESLTDNRTFEEAEADVQQPKVTDRKRKENPYKFIKFWFTESFEKFQKDTTIEIISTNVLITGEHKRVVDSKIVDKSNVCFCIVYKEISHARRTD